MKEKLTFAKHLNSETVLGLNKKKKQLNNYLPNI